MNSRREELVGEGERGTAGEEVGKMLPCRGSWPIIQAKLAELVKTHWCSEVRQEVANGPHSS